MEGASRARGSKRVVVVVQASVCVLASVYRPKESEVSEVREGLALGES